ncbi:MAG: biotin/lipoate A/B protein ligase family protein [Geitlerinemataceae cyanobacterium]
MTDNPSIWRLIPLLEAPGHVHMAIDRWLLEQHRLGLHPPTLRFYTWSPPAISLGYHQKRWLPHWQNLTWRGQSVELVRRPTGGRAVLHCGDLTYAVVMSPEGQNRMQSYRSICEFLIEGWRTFGVELRYGSDLDYTRSPNCFATATSADLVDTTGAKFIGSAQLRREKAILQHGSIGLAPDIALFSQVFGSDELPLLRPLTDQITDIVEALTAAASRCFGVRFVTEPLSELEWQAVSREVPLLRVPELIPEVRAPKSRDGEPLKPGVN